MMSRKNYHAIAQALVRARHYTRAKNLQTATITQAVLYNNVCSEIADVLEFDNPRFNREKFIEACEGAGEHDS